jgi:formyltetrahydrofolate synthetase
VAKNNRHKIFTRKLEVCLSEVQYEEIRKEFLNSTSRSASEYCRNLLTGKPVTVYTRSKSLDHFIAEMIQLRKELNAIGNHFSGSVEWLRRQEGTRDLNTWVILQEKNRQLLFEKTEEIKEKIYQISDRWLQE